MTTYHDNIPFEAELLRFLRSLIFTDKEKVAFVMKLYGWKEPGRPRKQHSPVKVSDKEFKMEALAGLTDEKLGP